MSVALHPGTGHGLIERLARLTKIHGGPRDAFAAFRNHFADRFPDVGFALLHAREHVALAGFVGADGSEIVQALDPHIGTSALPRFDDALAQRLGAIEGPVVAELTPEERALPLAQALLAPTSMFVAHIDDRGADGFRLVLTSDASHRFDRVDGRALIAEARVVFAILAAGFREQLVVHQHAEIEGLADIQRLLQPDNPDIRGLEYAVHWQPAATAAGDYYDLMKLTPFIDDFVDRGADAWGISIADVSGHGAAAAMEAVQFDAILRTYEGDEPPGGPAGAVTYANRYFFSRRQRKHFMTLMLVAGRPDVERIVYVCAGHLPGIVRRADGRIERIGAGADTGIPLGILREHRWENHELAFAPGDALVVYTDGIVEARDQRSRMFGAERLERVVAAGDGSPNAILARIREALFAHQRGEIGNDDQTIIVVRSVAEPTAATPDATP